ncbi:MAG: hypothetical protein SGPRY_014467, partial [Prymnesium sp.]
MPAYGTMVDEPYFLFWKDPIACMAPNSAVVIVTPSTMVCPPKLARWKRWASDASSLGLSFHLLVDGELQLLPPDVWNTNAWQVHAMANESDILRRFDGMQWGESTVSGTVGTPGAAKLQWYNHFPFYLHWWEKLSVTSTAHPYDYV